MTHEEAVTSHVAQVVRSYRDLPLILYHFQVKERDEPRPRAGVLRTREFVMKDSYSFDRDQEGLAARATSCTSRPTTGSSTAPACAGTASEATSGMMGGTGAHEYMAPCPAGENDVALAPGYAANVEVASARAAARSSCRAPLAAPEAVQHARARPRSRRSPAALGVPEGALLKAYPGDRADGARRWCWWCVRGDHRVNEIKLANALRRAVAARRRARGDRAARSARPASSGRSAPERAGCCSTTRVAPQGRYVVGANRPDEHLRGVEPGPRLRRSSAPTCATVERGRPVGGQPDHDRAGDRGRQHLQARHPLLRAAGRHLPRRAAAPSSRSGWAPTGSARRASSPPRSSSSPTSTASPGRAAIAPFAVHLVALGKPGHARARRRRARSTRRCARAASRCSTTTATLGPGEKFADAELLGCPLRLTVGRRSLESGEIEVQVRRGREQAPGCRCAASPRRCCGRGRAVAEPPLEAVRRRGARGRRRFARLLGLDRSGPPPPQTRAGQPLRPWTIPNAIGFVRAGADPRVPGRSRCPARDGTDALAGDRCSP